MAGASFSTMSVLSTALFGLAALQGVTAHTWIEQMQVIGTNGSYIGDYGYPRGYVARTDPSFTGFSDKWQLPSPDTDIGRTRITDKMPLCHTSQRKPNYSEQYPQLSVAPGSYVAMKYTENGHVTQPFLPPGKPAGSGTVFIYGTYNPSETETLVNVLSWTKDGKGGDGKGWLMSAQDYDDGRCHQLNQSPLSINRQMSDGDHYPGQPTSQLEQWCESDVLIPADAQVGKDLTVYWVWSWATGMETEGALCGKDEYYTTCSDFKVVDGGDDLSQLASVPKVHTLSQQDPQSTAVSAYQSRTAHNPSPTIITTQECSYTSATSSEVPASLSQPTTLAAGFSTSISRPPMPKYRVGGSPAGNSSQPASSEATSTAAASPTSSAQQQSSAAPTATSSASSAQGQVGAIGATQTVTVTAPGSTVFMTVSAGASASTAPASASSAPASASSAPAGASPSIVFSTNTIPAPAASSAPAVGKRDTLVQAHGRLRHNIRA